MLSLQGCVIPGIPFLGGLGAGSYGCTNNVCVGNSADVVTEFRRLQALINQAAQKLGMGAPLVVDGKIGPATVAKLIAVTVAMPSRPDLPTLMTTDSSTTPSDVAAQSSYYVDELEALISGEIQFPAETVTPPSTQVTLPTNIPPRTGTTRPTPGAGPTATMTTATTAIRTMPPAAKVVLGAIAIGAVAWLIASRKPAASGVSGARRRRRR